MKSEKAIAAAAVRKEVNNFRLRVLADIIAQKECGMMTKEQATRIAMHVTDKSADKQMKEYALSGCSVEDAVELFTYAAGVH